MEGICRTCLNKSSSLSTIFQDDLPSKIRTISSIEVKKGDELSDKICVECVTKLDECYTFRNMIIKCDSLMKMGLSEDDSSSSPSKAAIYKDKPNRDDIDENVRDDIDENTRDDIDNNISDDVGNNIRDDDLCEVKIEIEDTGEVYMKDYNPKESMSDGDIRKRTGRVNKYQCKVCYFQGKDTKDLMKHSGRAHKQMVNCEICNVFFEKRRLKIHMLNHSTEDNSISCPICKRVYKNLDTYNSHKTFHIPEESTCEICGKQFQSKGERMRHINRHNTKKPTHTCETCGKVFHKMASLKRHQQVHTGEKPHVCSFCGKKCSSRWAMRTHERQHTNEMPYKCQLCPMAFRQRVLLRTHVRTKH